MGKNGIGAKNSSFDGIRSEKPGSTSYKPFKKAKLSRNEVLQYRGKNATSKFKLENPERKGESLCSILGCCPGVDLQCFGCHPGLLDMGIPCEKQPTSTHSPQRRDCFCDTSCILFEDCCDDHFGACAELYNVSIFYSIFKSSFLR